MIFKPQFVTLVLAGRKTQTRRPVQYLDAQGKGAGYKPCAYQVGRDYAVQPGRGQHAVARLRVLEVTQVPVNSIDGWDAIAEGFASRAAFLEWWRDFYGHVEGDCWRIRFTLDAASRPLEPEERAGCPVCFATAVEACLMPAGSPRPDHAARGR